MVPHQERAALGRAARHTVSPLGPPRTEDRTGDVLSGVTVEGTAATLPEAVCRRHLLDLGAALENPDAGPLRTGPDDPLTLDLSWGPPGPGRPRDEVTVQAAAGLMLLHGRRTEDGPRRLGVDYASVAAGVVATQGMLAGLLARARGRRVTTVSTSVLESALLTVSHYLAMDTAEDESYETPPPVQGTPPPFHSREGTAFELECLDPRVWKRWWELLGVSAGTAGRGWLPYVRRYADATAPLPAELHEATRARPLSELAETARETGAGLCPLRGSAERRAELGLQGDTRIGAPWRITPLGRGAAALPLERELPLAGLRVVEAGRRIQGPLAGNMLRLLGAEVVRLEPVGGDLLRGMPPIAVDCSAGFLAINRDKRVVEADLSTPAGRDLALELVADADVLLHNWAPGKAAQLRLETGDLAAVNPGLVYAWASGWADVPVPGDLPGTDFLAQAHSGLAEALHPAGEQPAVSLVTLLDVLGGLVAAEGVLAALLARQRTGRGQRVDSSLLSAAAVLQTDVLESGGGAAHWGPLDRPLPTGAGHLMLPKGTREADLFAAVATAQGAAGSSGEGEGAGGLPVRYGRLADRPASAWVPLLDAAGIPAVEVCSDLAALPADQGLAELFHQRGAAFLDAPWRFR